MGIACGGRYQTHAEEIKQLQEEYIKAATAANASNKGKAPM
jgi:hypothetical protein